MPFPLPPLYLDKSTKLFFQEASLIISIVACPTSELQIRFSSLFFDSNHCVFLCTVGYLLDPKFLEGRAEIFDLWLFDQWLFSK